MALSSAVRASRQAPRPRAMRPVDLVYLAKQCQGDEHREYAMLRQFESRISLYLAHLSAATTNEDIAATLGTIIGSATAVGAVSVASLARAAQDQLATGTSPTIETIADLGHAIEEARAFIGDMLA